MAKKAEVIELEDIEHSDVGASGAHRWLECAGSPQLYKKERARGVDVDAANELAAEGTAAHLVLSTCLENGKNARSMLGTIIKVDGYEFNVDKDMAAHIQKLISWVRKRIKKAEADGFEVTLHVEVTMSSFTDEEAASTSDVVIHIHGDRMIIIDLKYGANIMVEPDSVQNKYYGYLACENLVDIEEEIKTVESYIFQPRIPHKKGLMRRYVTSVDELTEWWMGTVIPGIVATREPDPLFTMGDWCKFCDVKGSCPARKQELVEVPTDVDPEFMDDGELGSLLTKAKRIVALEKILSKEALARLNDGKDIPEFKLVRGVSSRAFVDSIEVENEETGKLDTVKFEDAVVEEFELEAYAEAKFLPMTKIEKLDGGKEFVEKWTHKPLAGLTLAAESDKRPAVKPTMVRYKESQS